MSSGLYYGSCGPTQSICSTRNRRAVTIGSEYVIGSVSSLGNVHIKEGEHAVHNVLTLISVLNPS